VTPIYIKAIIFENPVLYDADARLFQMATIIVDKSKRCYTLSFGLNTNRAPSRGFLCCALSVLALVLRADC